MLTLDKSRALPEKMYLCCGLSFRLRSRLNLSPVSNERLQNSADILVLGKKRTLVRFEFPFNSIGKCQWLFFNMSVMARTSFYNRLSSQK